MRNFFKKIKKIYNKNKYKNSYFNSFNLDSNKSYLNNNSKGYLDSYLNLVYVSICCDAICRDVVKNGYYFSDKYGVKLNNNDIDESILLPFINGFYSNSFLDLIKIVLYHRLLTGNGFLKKDKISVYSSYKNSYDRFTPILPNEIKTVISEDGKELLHYELRLKNGRYEILDKDEIIHFKQNAIFSPFIGVGNIEKMRLMAEGELASQFFNNEFMLNKAFPSVIFSDETPLRPGDYERYYDLIQKRFRSSNGKAFYVNGTNFKIHQLNPSYQDMQFLEQKKYNEQAIYELFGCYKLTDVTNRATAEIKRLKYLENTINPIIFEIEETINHQHMGFLKENNEIFFRINKYKTNDVENIIKMLNNGIITPNRASELLGEDFDIKSYERSSFYISSNLIPIGIDENNKKKIKNLEEGVNLSDCKNVNQIVSYFFKNSRKNKYFQTKYLKKALISRNKIENKFTLILKRFFKKQIERIHSNLDINYNNIKNINIHKKDIYNNEDLNIFFSLKNEDKFLKKYINSLHEDTFEQAINDVNYIVNSNITFDSNKINYLKNFLGSLIIGSDAKNNINRYTQKKVYNIIIYSINNNLTINEIQNELSVVFDSFSSYRTRTIARTESRLAWDVAATETYKQLDVKKVDVVGCTQFEPNSDCGKKGVLLTEVLNLRFHPNHVGALAPEISP